MPDDSALAFFEWSAGDMTPGEVTDELATDEEAWARANPAFGIRIQAEHIEHERNSMDGRGFAVERLGIGDWPPTEGGSQVFDREAWAECEDKGSGAENPVVFAFDVRPDRSHASIGVAGARKDGLDHIELIDRRAGTGWVPNRIAELVGAHRPRRVVCDGASPAASLIPELQAQGVQVETVNASQHAQGCGRIFDAVGQRKLRHLGQPELNAAVRGAAKRPLGDAWAWSRKNSQVDIGPLVACTLAFWAHSEFAPAPFAFVN